MTTSRPRRPTGGPTGRPTGSDAERGIALLVALALLTALTVATLAVAQTTTLELAMARNDEDAARAFYAADAALTEAEAWLRANATDPKLLFSGSSSGLLAAPAYGAQGPSALDVRTAGRAAAAPSGVAAPPRYVIEWLGGRRDSGTTAQPLPPAQVDWYRITARGVGSSFAVALAQSTWGQTRDGGTERALTGRLSWTRLGE